MSGLRVVCRWSCIGLADTELKGHVVAGLKGPAVNGRPLQESHCDTMLAAADLGIQRAVFVQIHPEEAAVGVFLHVVLIHAVDG